MALKQEVGTMSVLNSLSIPNFASMACCFYVPICKLRVCTKSQWMKQWSVGICEINNINRTTQIVVYVWYCFYIYSCAGVYKMNINIQICIPKFINNVIADLSFKFFNIPVCVIIENKQIFENIGTKEKNHFTFTCRFSGILYARSRGLVTFIRLS